MLDSRHAPRYLRWFDRVALIGGVAILLALMLMLASAFQTDNQAASKAPSQRARADTMLDFVESLFSEVDE